MRVQSAVKSVKTNIMPISFLKRGDKVRGVRVRPCEVELGWRIVCRVLVMVLIKERRVRPGPRKMVKGLREERVQARYKCF